RPREGGPLAASRKKVQGLGEGDNRRPCTKSVLLYYAPSVPVYGCVITVGYKCDFDGCVALLKTGFQVSYTPASSGRRPRCEMVCRLALSGAARHLAFQG